MPSRRGRPPDPNRRPLDPGWRERHIRGQADGTMPLGKIPLTYEDGTPVLDRLGRQRWWSECVEAATRPRPAEGWLGAAPPAPRVTPGRTASRAVLAPDPGVITVRIRASNPNEPPMLRPPSSREIARRKAKAEEAARAAAGARALAGQVQRGVRPPTGRLFAVDVAGLLLIGPAGGIGSSERMARTLAPLVAGDRHPAAVLVSAGSWRDEVALGEALKALAPKLAAIGVRIDRRKTGIRMAKLKPPSRPRDAGDMVQ